MALNHAFWLPVFQDQFIPQLTAIIEVLEDRILSGFKNIEKEAEDLSNDRWEEFMSSPGSGDEDPSEFAEIAEHAGVSHYILLSGIRQGILNLFSVFLYHMFEQQILLFHRKEVLSPQEENNVKLFNFKEFKKRLKEKGIDIQKFSSWSKVYELSLVANAVKHAEGPSAQKLKSQRPDLFKNPDLLDLGLSFTISNTAIFLPLSGVDIYVSLEEVQVFKNALHDFYRELLHAMESI